MRRQNWQNGLPEAIHSVPVNRLAEHDRSFARGGWISVPSQYRVNSREGHAEEHRCYTGKRCMRVAVPVRTQIVNGWLHKVLNPDEKTVIITTCHVEMDFLVTIEALDQTQEADP